MRTRLTLIATVVASLAVPASAAATTYTVAAGGGTCGGTNTTCETIADAAGAAGSGDTVQIAPGTYTESPTFPAPKVTITGSTEAAGVVISGSVTFSGDGGAPSVLQRLVVAAPTAGGPAVEVTGGAGVAVRDALLLGTAGTGMAIFAGANEITRSTVLSGAAAGSAVAVRPGGASTTLTLSSSVLAGGGGGTGLSVITGTGQLPGSAGGATIAARHITVAGAANGIVLDSSAAVGVAAAVGSIVATVRDSIVLGAISTRNYAGLVAPLIPPNVASLNLTRTEQTASADALFINPAKRNFHLRANATSVIDKGQVTPADSPTDIDGQPRTAGAASDLGADEFGNTPPTAGVAIKSGTPRARRPVTFDGSASADREAGFGGGIAEYRWTFGDGKSQTTTTPTVKHRYAKEGTVVAQLVVVDRQGAASAPASVPVALIDGTPPSVVIARPKPKAEVRLLTKKRKRATIAFSGTAKDASGMKDVYLTIQKVGSSKKTCTWLDKAQGLVKGKCAMPVLIRTKLRSKSWRYKVASTIKLSKGEYRVSAYGVDGTGLLGNVGPKKTRVIRITLR